MLREDDELIGVELTSDDDELMLATRQGQAIRFKETDIRAMGRNSMGEMCIRDSGVLREPQDIGSYSALACIAIQSNQNDQHGGQAIASFDYDMAPGVAKTYILSLIHIYPARPSPPRS